MASNLLERKGPTGDRDRRLDPRPDSPPAAGPRASGWSKSTSSARPAAAASRCARRCSACRPKGSSTSRSIRGASVRNATMDEVRQLYHARGAMEGICAADFTRLATPAQKAELADIAEQMETCVAGPSPEHFARLNAQWHNLIMDGAGDHVIKGIVQRLNTPIHHLVFETFYRGERLRAAVQDHRRDRRRDHGRLDVRSPLPDQTEAVLTVRTAAMHPSLPSDGACWPAGDAVTVTVTGPHSLLPIAYDAALASAAGRGASADGDGPRDLRAARTRAADHRRHRPRSGVTRPRCTHLPRRFVPAQRPLSDVEAPENCAAAIWSRSCRTRRSRRGSRVRAARSPATRRRWPRAAAPSRSPPRSPAASRRGG